MIHLVLPNPAVDRTLLVAGFQAGIPNRPYEVKDFPGGKSFNVAYAILKEGQEDVCVHALLGGFNGQRVQALAQDQGVQVRALLVEKNTRECHVIVDTDTATVYPVYEPGLELTPDLLARFTDQLLEAIQPGDWVVFSGSLMEGMPADYIPRLQEAINDPRVHFVVDTSGPAMQAVYDRGQPYLVKINDQEYNELFGTQLEGPQAFIHHLKEQVADRVQRFIVTLGGQGAVAKLGDQYYHLQAEAITAKNPVASGDFFLGGLLRGLVSGEAAEDILLRAMAYATVNCLYWYPYIDLEVVEAIRDSIQIQTQ